MFDDVREADAVTFSAVPFESVAVAVNWPVPPTDSARLPVIAIETTWVDGVVGMGPGVLLSQSEASVAATSTMSRTAHEVVPWYRLAGLMGVTLLLESSFVHYDVAYGRIPWSSSAMPRARQQSPDLQSTERGVTGTIFAPGLGIPCPSNG